jgi:hypothetical protein
VNRIVSIVLFAGDLKWQMRRFQDLTVTVCQSMSCSALYRNKANAFTSVRGPFEPFRRFQMSSTRHHDPSVLQKLPDVTTAVTSAASLDELVAFCRQQRLKPTVYTGRPCCTAVAVCYTCCGSRAVRCNSIGMSHVSLQAHCTTMQLLECHADHSRQQHSI